jgi:hypothetical protein
MFLQGHYQNAYVTHDLGRAMDLVSERYGVTDYITFDPEMMLRTADGEKLQKVKVAATWVGWLQIELIEPVSGFVDPFLPFLPADKSDVVPRLHHISLRRESLAEIHAESDKLGLPFVCEGGIPDLVFRYLDARGTLGHYLEYVWASPAGWAMVGWPEGRPAI